MKVLEERYQSYLNCGNVFGKVQCKTFLNLANKKYAKVLDVGCGKGFFTYLFLKEKEIFPKSCYGTDIFDDCQEKEIKRLLPNFSFHKIGKSGKLPFPDNSFDLVFSIDVLEHVHNAQNFIAEQIRVTNKGGEIIIGTPNYLRLTNLFLLLFGRHNFPRKVGVDTYGDVIHVKEYKKSDLIILLGEFKEEIANLHIFPCWLGSSPLHHGLARPVGLLSNFCQFWFVKFTKN